MATINYNYAANAASNVINKNERMMDKTMAKISSGSSVGVGNNSPGAFSVHTALKGEGTAARAGLDNINTGISYLKLAESTAMVLLEITERMRELATKASNVASLQDDRNALDYEFQSQMTEYQRLVADTSFNGTAIMTGTSLVTNTGAATAITHVMDNWSIATFAALGEGMATGAIITGTAASGGGVTASFLQTALAAAGDVPATKEENLTTAATAAATLAKLNNMIPHLASSVGRIGGYISQMEFSSDQTAGRAVVMEQAASKVGDTDYAVETARLASQSIVSQAATAILAQANARSDTVLTLLR
jgi:flagellin